MINSSLSFRKFIQDSDDEDAEKGSGEEGESQLLTRRIKTQEEKVRNCCLLLPYVKQEVYNSIPSGTKPPYSGISLKDKEESDYVEWLKGQAELEGPEEVKDMVSKCRKARWETECDTPILPLFWNETAFLSRQKYLRDYWNDPELDEKEQFLRDYVLNKCYLDEDDDDERYVPPCVDVSLVFLSMNGVVNCNLHIKRSWPTKDPDVRWGGPGRRGGLRRRRGEFFGAARRLWEELQLPLWRAELRADQNLPPQHRHLSALQRRPQKTQKGGSERKEAKGALKKKNPQSIDRILRQTLRILTVCFVYSVWHPLLASPTFSGERAEAGAAEAAEELEAQWDRGEAEEAPGADGQRAARVQPGRPGGRVWPTATRSAHGGRCENVDTGSPVSVSLLGFG